MVFAVLFVVAVGLGPFAGVLAIFVHTTGMLAKLFSEAVEAIDPRPVEGIRATGADPRPGGRLRRRAAGACRSGSATRSIASNPTCARRRCVGLVGAGGIGQVLFETIRGFDYQATSAILIIIIVTVSVLDIASQRLRKLFV